MLGGCDTSYEPTYEIVINAEVTIPDVLDYNATEECITYLIQYQEVNKELCGDFVVVSDMGLPIKDTMSEVRYYNGTQYERYAK